MNKIMCHVHYSHLTLNPQTEEIIAEEQAGFRAGRSTTEQIFNLRILCEKYLQHQQNLYHVFIDFKKAFDRVWHAALWTKIRKYNISANLVRTIEQLYDKATSAVQMNGSIGEWVRTSRSKARMSSVTHPPQFFSNGSCLMPWKNMMEGSQRRQKYYQSAEALAEYKMKISAEKTKLVTNSANGIQREIKVKRQKLSTVTSFKYLGAVVSDDGSKPEFLSRIAQATAALTKLKPIWKDNNISIGSKVKLMRSLVISIFLYAS